MKNKMVTLSSMFIVAGTLTACADAPVKDQPMPRTSRQLASQYALLPAEGPTSVWHCYRMSDNAYVGYVSILSGHTPVEATHACNHRIPACTNSPGKCLTRYAYAT
ncbi:hypothetical protein [Hyalangium gracile]|uniref:hypothetical protein n=1 Tax=Hyalangium gracile TaxID=394092 RepID=UPI001CCFBC00|nr:hypothetical protein [Hyalangium gracile]